MAKKRLGEILIDAGLVTSSIIDEALNNKRENQKIGDYLVEKGFVREDLMYEKLSLQLQIPLFKLSEIDIKQNALDSIGKELLNKYTAFPVELSGSLLTLAMEDPLDDAAIKEIENSIQLDVVGVFGLKSELLDYIGKYYDIDDSMIEFFGMNDKGSSDRNELQIADTFFSHLKSNNKFTIVISETRGRLSIKIGEISFISKKDIKYLLDFLKKIVGYEDNLDEFNVLLNQNDNKVNIRMLVKRSKSQVEYWIDSILLNNEEDKELLGLENYTKSGIYVLLNNAFKNTEILKIKLQSLQTYEEKRILVHSSDVTYEKYGLNVLDIPYSEINDYVNFGELFLLDYGWEIENVVPLLRLLREDKTVYLHTPFSSRQEFINYLEKLGVSEIINKFIVDYIEIK